MNVTSLEPFEITVLAPWSSRQGLGYSSKADKAPRTATKVKLRVKTVARMRRPQDP